MGYHMKAAGASARLFVVVLVAISVSGISESLLMLGNMSIRSTGFVETSGHEEALQYVSGDRIFDGNGSEIIWRGVGGSYLFDAGSRYQEAWQLHLPEIQAMGLNTIRLAFRFPWDTVSTADVLDYAKLAWIVDFLWKNGIKSILDNHGGMGFGSENLMHSWRELAARYVDDGRVAAYELFNEPGYWSWDSWIENRVDVTKAYVQLTQSLREVDPRHIVVWQAPPYYIAPFEDILDCLQPNVVYTLHRWWTHPKWEFGIWAPEEISRMTLSYVVEYRKFGVPFWFGEFGAHWPFNASNPEWLLAEQHLWRCEELVVGWNLWMGDTDMSRPWRHYLLFFPLKVFNRDLLRQSWSLPNPNLVDCVVDRRCVDRLEPCRIELWHNRDYVKLKSGIVVRVIVNRRYPDGPSEIVSDQEMTLTEETTIGNVERTTEFPGDWNTNIYAIGCVENE
jgi:hypothetical protein